MNEFLPGQADMGIDAGDPKPKCGQKGCALDAEARVHWPGRGSPKAACAEHRDQAKAYAGAMGMTLLIERLP